MNNRKFANQMITLIKEVFFTSFLGFFFFMPPIVHRSAPVF